MVGTAHRNTGVEGVEGRVGLTALLVAAARAIETHRHDSLAQDVYAEHFGSPHRRRRAGRYACDRFRTGTRTRCGGGSHATSDCGRGSSTTSSTGPYMTGGARQVVLLGAGLDSRAFRLDRPPGCVIFEIDREGVPAFKHEVLGGLPADPKAARIPIAVDLRADWAGALTDAGFDTAAPSVWLAEGLLFYLSEPCRDLPHGPGDWLTTGGSALAFEAKLEEDLLQDRDSPLYTATKDQIGIDLLDLFDREPRPDSAGTRGQGLVHQGAHPLRLHLQKRRVPCRSRTTRWRGTGGSSRTAPVAGP